MLGVDLSRIQLRLARQAAPGAALVRADITELALRPGSVDAVASCCAFGHVPPAAHSSLLRSIASWLRPGGLLLTSTPITADHETAPDWLGVPMYFGAIGERATRQAVWAAGLHLDATRLVAEDEGKRPLRDSFGSLRTNQPRPDRTPPETAPHSYIGSPTGGPPPHDSRLVARQRAPRLCAHVEAATHGG